MTQTINFAWTKADNSTDGGWTIDRSTDGGTTWSQLEDITTPSTTSASTTEPDGLTVDYRLQRYTDHATSGFVTDSLTTTLPAPTLDSVSVTADDAALSWTTNSTDYDGVRVQYKPSSGSTWTTDADLSGTATSHTITDLLDGEQYDFRVQAYTQDATSNSNVLTDTTEAAQITGLSLANGVEDEITASWDDTADYGDYRAQIKESSSASWFQDEATVGEATSSYTFGSLEDGEEFDVRVRHETEHVTGAWSSVATITTKFPTPTSVSASATGKTSVDVTWSDQSDNEDGFRIHREEKFGSSFGPRVELADLAPNTTAYTDSTALPGTEYRYTVEGYTEDATVEASDTTTTTAAGVPTSDVAATGWTVEVQHPDGQWLDVQLVGEPTRRPTLNGLPRVEIPVPKTEAWTASTWDRQPMRVWYNGRRQPIDRLADVETQPGQTTLVGVGGVELRERVERMVQSEESHTLADDLVTTNTSYATNVDAPNAGSDNDVPIQTASTTATFEDIIRSGASSTDPAAAQNGGLELLQSLFFLEAEDNTGAVGSEVIDDGTYSGEPGTAVTLSETSHVIEFTFTPAYTIPGENVGFQLRKQNPGSGHHAYDIKIDGTVVERRSAGVETTGETDANWGTYALNATTPPDLTAGTQHTLEVDITNLDSDGDWYADCLAIYDSRYSYTFDDSVTNGILEGPELYPDQHTVTVETVTPGRQIIDATVTTSMNDTSGTQRLGLSFDGGTYSYGTNTDTYSESAPSGTVDVAWEVRLSRYGTQSTTPTDGINGQSVDSATLSATLDNTPIVLNRLLDGRLVDVLNDIASDGDFIWQYTLDDSGNPTVQWTQPGQRTRDEAIPLSDYTTTKDMSVVKKAIVYGTSQPAEDTVTANHGTAVSLTNDYLQETSEKVLDPSSGTQFERGVDYEFDELAGEITTLASGSVTDGSDVRVEYERKTRGSYEAPTFSGDPEAVEVATVPGVTTDQAAQQVAITIVSQLSTPRWTASVDVHTNPNEWTLVDALSLDGVPVDGSQLEVYSVEDTPRGASMQLGSRDTIEETIGQIRSQLEGVSRKI